MPQIEKVDKLENLGNNDLVFFMCLGPAEMHLHMKPFKHINYKRHNLSDAIRTLLSLFSHWPRRQHGTTQLA